MKLLDIANDLNRAANAVRKAAEESEKQRAAHYRAVSYYKEFGNKWFSELLGEIETLLGSFNKTAGEHAMLKAHLNSGSEIDSIAIELITQNTPLVCANGHSSVVQKHDDLKVLIQVINGSNASHLECDVKIAAFTEFKVQVILSHEKNEIDEKATDRYCDINDANFFPIFKTVTTEEKKILKTNEFAEFVLTYFVQVARKKQRK
jgi:hypothetical protein